jgi:methylenetetrahydrofolate dehydrogenase (NADP+) / methenyltetrahydrofolate cyclohydrolase
VNAQIIDGKAIAARRRAALAAEVAGLSYRPGLAVVLVGENPASTVYVRNKDRAAAAAGIASRTLRLSAETEQAALLSVIRDLNNDADVDAVLVQLPLPPQLRARAVIEAIDPAKDVDGFHPLNVGRLHDGLPGLVPCTPRGVMLLLEEAGVALPGTRALVLGRSAIVGKPTAALLMHADATVTIAHSRTRDLPALCREAEVLVAAIGRPEFVRGDWIRPGAVVIDVGVNRLESGTLVGDVAFTEAAAVASAITPVPGGVGPMTIACLLENTLLAARARRGQS